MSARRIAIIGGGISGLAAAYFLQRETAREGLEAKITLLERSGRLGGVIRTEQTGDFLLEAGPEAFFAAKPAALDLVTELGFANRLVGSNDQLRRTFVVHAGKLHPLPDGLALVAPVRIAPICTTSLISTRGKIRTLMEPLIPRSSGDPSVRAFLERRLGREFTANIADPLVSAIFGADTSRLSASSALPGLFRAEQAYGSLWRGIRKTSIGKNGTNGPCFVAPENGMAQMVQWILSAISSVNIQLHIGSTKIQRRRQSYVIKTDAWEESFDAVVVATPANVTSKLVSGFSGRAAQALASIEYSTTSLIFLAYKRSEFSHPLNGFGFVMPEQESMSLDACTWVSSKFKSRCPPDHVLLRCAIHDGRRSRMPGSDDALIQTAHAEIARILGVSCHPALSRVFHARGSMPQMNVGHAVKLREIRDLLSRCPGFFLAGAFQGGVGIPDCIAGAQKAANSALQYLQATAA